MPRKQIPAKQSSPAKANASLETSQSKSGLKGPKAPHNKSPSAKSLPEPSQHECILRVPNKMGIHARPAAMIVRIANKYPKATIEIEKDNERVNGKSIMGVMTLAAGKGSQLRFIASGKNAAAFIEEISNLFKSAFGEI